MVKLVDYLPKIITLLLIGSRRYKREMQPHSFGAHIVWMSSAWCVLVHGDSMPNLGRQTLDLMDEYPLIDG